jgi:hypothetical protein
MKALPFVGYTSWCALGFYRGVNSYEYEKKKTNMNTYLYLNSFGYGCCGILFYANPCLMPLSVYKEIYRFEIKMRQLEQTDYYHQIF